MTTTKPTTTVEPIKKETFKGIVAESCINTVKVYNETALTAVAICQAIRHEVEDFTS
jgi:hypothetical protein